MFFTPDAYLFGLVQGFVVGPVTLYGIREGLNPQKGFWFQAQVILGATLTEIFYLMLATHGVATFVQWSGVRFAMWSVAAYMLLHMGIVSLHEHLGKMTFAHAHRHKLHFYETDFVKAMGLALMNPLGIVFALMIVGSLYATYTGTSTPAAFALNVMLGGLTGSMIVALLTLIVKHVFHPWMLRKLVQGGSFIMIGYGVYFFWNAVKEVGPLVDQVAASLLYR